MKAKMGINTGFALNRFPEHEEWMKIVSERFGLKYVQLTADLLSPYLPAEILFPQIKTINELRETYSITIDSTFTGAFTRLNHLSSPYLNVRKYWVHWFKRFAELSHELGAKTMGSHFGILTVSQLNNPDSREKILTENIKCWHEIAKHAEEIGLENLMWEPMSIKREYGETIEATESLQKRINDGIAVPMKLCLDVDHGDVASTNPEDTNPYAWLEKFGSDAKSIHVKQSSADKGGHWPFTQEKNASGRIHAERVLAALERSGAQDIILHLELSFKEREPYESRVLDDIEESVKYWRNHVGD